MKETLFYTNLREVIQSVPENKRIHKVIANKNWKQETPMLTLFALTFPEPTFSRFIYSPGLPKRPLGTEGHFEFLL